MYLIIIALLTQALFTTSDVLGRKYMNQYGFNFRGFFHPWFLTYIMVRVIASFGQLYIFSQVPLGKTMIIFGMMGLILANVIGVLYLNEVMNLKLYISLTLAIAAIIILLLK